MNLSEIINYCLEKPGAWTDFPFDDETMVIKAGSRMFCLIGNEKSTRINLKCDPLRAVSLRDQYSAVIPGYHMNKKHWNTLLLNSDLPADLILELIDHSYDLVTASLSLQEKNRIRK